MGAPHEPKDSSWTRSPRSAATGSAVPPRASGRPRSALTADRTSAWRLPRWGGGALRITRFDVNLNTGYLNAETVLNGKRLPGRVDIFALGAAKPINGSVPRCDGIQAGLTLTPGAAKACGAPSFAGAFVGDACVVPGEHEDDD